MSTGLQHTTCTKRMVIQRISSGTDGHRGFEQAIQNYELDVPLILVDGLHVPIYAFTCGSVVGRAEVSGLVVENSPSRKPNLEPVQLFNFSHQGRQWPG